MTTTDAVDLAIVASRRSGMRYADPTDHALAILTAAQAWCYSSRTAAHLDPDWLAGYRILTRAMFYIGTRRYPGESVNGLTGTDNACH